MEKKDCNKQLFSMFFGNSKGKVLCAKCRKEIIIEEENAYMERDNNIMSLIHERCRKGD